ncbi:hypothetical protein P3T25_003026 [Paraburkholderia sp. GAS32]
MRFRRWQCASWLPLLEPLPLCRDALWESERCKLLPCRILACLHPLVTLSVRGIDEPAFARSIAQR